MPRDRRPAPRAKWFAVATAAPVLVGIGVVSVVIVESNEQLAAGNRADAVVVDVDDVAAPSIPPTVPPLPDASDPRASGQAHEPVAVVDPTTSVADTPYTAEAAAADPLPSNADAGLSPLADLLGPTYSVVPADVAPRPQPIGLAIDSIDVADYPIRDVGLEDDGQLEVPDETEIGWYKYGATAGRPGATVLAAHVSWNRTTGPFFELGRVEPGDRISVALEDGTTREYDVVERTMYDKNELPRDRIWRNTGPETLVLITCGGDFNPEIRRYRQNIVVYAVPVA